MTPRIHLVGLPHTQSTDDYTTCAFTANVVKFARMMAPRGWEITVYSGEHNDAPCDEHVALFSDGEQAGWFGAPDPHDFSPIRWDDPDAPYWRTMNERAAAQITARVATGDIVGTVGGYMQAPIFSMMRGDVLNVEYAVGHRKPFAPYRCFPSNAWATYCAGQDRDMSPRWFDTVIPHYFDPTEFTYEPRPAGYALWIGRMIETKGPHVAEEIAARINLPLVMAGQGAMTDGEWVHGAGRTMRATHLGAIGPDRRAQLLAEAEAGYEHCRTLNRLDIRDAARARLSFGAIAPRYEAWFETLTALYRKGWYA